MGEKQKPFALADLVMLSDLEPVSHIPFGVAPLDGLTRGGIPEGHFTLLSGPERSGKTTTAQLAIRGFQSLYPNLQTIWISSEKRIDKSWARKLGIDPGKVAIDFPFCGEAAWALMKTAVREWKEVGLIIVDSLANLTPQAEAESDPMKDEFTAIGPRMANRMYREVSSALNYIATKENRKVSIIIINQERESTKITWGNPTILPMGKAQLFLSSLHLRFFKSDIEHEDEKARLKFPLFAVLRFRVMKNIDGPSDMDGEARLCVSSVDGWRAGEFDDLDWVWLQGTRYGLIYPVKGEPVKGQVEKGYYVGDQWAGRAKDEVFKRWREDPAFYATSKQAVLKQYWAARME